MNTFPFIKARWSNEHIMAALFAVLILYHIPRWIEHPAETVVFLLLTSAALLIDAAVSILKFKRLWCCVSAAVTAAIISILSPGAPLWVQLLGIIAALTIGKHIWGGTGKNKINPAMVGLLVVYLFYNIPYPFFGYSYLLLPALVLSLPFLRIRPFAGMGFVLGAIAAFVINRDFSLTISASCTVIFFSCIILTDPVTVTRDRAAGLILGLFAGFLSLFIHPNPLIFITMVFLVNIASFILSGLSTNVYEIRPKLKISKVFSYHPDEMLDLSGEGTFTEEAEPCIDELTAEEIIKIIKSNDIFGMGGAGYPTSRKLMAVLSSKEKNKYLIVNGVECDPGLIHDQYILRHFQTQIQKGIESLNKSFDFTSIHLAVKSSEQLDFPSNIRVHKVSDKYPAGAERILVNEVLGTKLNKGQLPAVCGILVLNVQTIFAIYKALYFNCPSATRFLTVANLEDKTAQVVRVPLGMKLKDILEKVYPGSKSMIAGGGIMNAHFAEEDSVVDKTTNFIATGGFPKYKESVQCSLCGNCAANCPVGIQVYKVADLVDQGKYKETAAYHVTQCIGCGSCSYSCLAGRSLAVKVKAAKNSVA